jgi:hypothetical protein
MRCPAGKLSTVLAAWHPPSGEAGLLLHRDVQHSAKESGRSVLGLSSGFTFGQINPDPSAVA